MCLYGKRDEERNPERGDWISGDTYTEDSGRIKIKMEDKQKDMALVLYLFVF